MKFHLAVNLERMNDATDVMAVKHTLEMVQMADRAGLKSPGQLNIMRWKRLRQTRFNCSSGGPTTLTAFVSDLVLPMLPTGIRSISG